MTPVDENLVSDAEEIQEAMSAIHGGRVVYRDDDYDLPELLEDDGDDGEPSDSELYVVFNVEQHRLFIESEEERRRRRRRVVVEEDFADYSIPDFVSNLQLAIDRDDIELAERLRYHLGVRVEIVKAEFYRAWSCFVGMEFLYSCKTRSGYFSHHDPFQYYEILFDYMNEVEDDSCQNSNCNDIVCGCSGLLDFKESLTTAFNNGEERLNEVYAQYLLEA